MTVSEALSQVPLTSYLLVGLILFSVGLYGALTKRNAVIVLLSIELMLNAVNINLVAFAKHGLYPGITGQIFSLFTITIAAAEVAVGVAILMALYRNRGTVQVDKMDLMKR
ncbi:MAG: NADH-quinone oxidoreductase subunit NuoK [Bacillaceae bacterium]|nr:NADH-quinone oxidoreductase subunit NuoK [Bacillaceae bacterium]